MDSTADDWLFDDDDEGNEAPSGLSDFQDKISDWGNSMQERARERRQEGAKNFGRFAEDGAAKTGSAAGKNGAGNSSFMSAVQNAKDAEGRGGFANNVKGKSLETAAATAVPGGKMFVNQAKKFGPLGTILLIVVALVGIFSGAQSLAPFGLVANGLDQFNNLRTSMNKRTTYFRRFSLDRTRNKSVTKASIFNPEHYKISASLSKKLKKQNIYYIDTDDFEARFLIYTDEDTGKTYAVAANDDDVSKLPSGGIDVEIDGEMRHFDIDADARVKIDDAVIDSDNFAKSFDVGTRTLKGHIAGWFDDLSAKLHGRLFNSRNRFKDTSDTASDEEVVADAKKTGMNEDIRGDASDAKEIEERQKKNADGSPAYDKDGNPDMEEVDVPIEGDSGVKKSETIDLDEPEIEAKVSSSLNAKAKAIAGAAGTAANTVCTAMKVYAAITAVVAGVHVANIINYLTGYLEAIQKTQTGDAGKNELAYYMNSLSQKGNTYDSDGNLIRENTSSLQSPAWNQFFSSGSLVIQASDPVAEKFNRDYVAKKSVENVGGVGYFASAMAALVGAAGGAAAAYRTCLYADMATASVDLVLDVVLAFFTGGIGNFIKDWAEKLFKTAVLAGLVAAITSVFMSFIPHIAKWMAMDLISNMAGEDAAYAINSGFNIYLGQQMQMSSGLPATEETLMAHWRAQQEVIAEEGALERSMKSPFDVTSKYTFFGSIMNSMIPIANTIGSPLATISKTVNTVGTAFMGLRPTAKAEGEAKFETSLNYDCENLKQLDLVGDAYCNPYFVTDMTTMSADPSEVFDTVATENDKMGIDDNFVWDDDAAAKAEADGKGYNPEIREGGELSKWVVSCAVRDSQFGTVDSNVLAQISALINTGNGALDTALETGISLLPFIGDIHQIHQAALDTNNLEWATGKNCVDEEYKYYSRYSEDQRIMESAGVIEESAVVAYLDKYYEKNPIDNSYEGVIARYSGLTKEQVEETLAYIDYYEWLAEYDPTDAGPEQPLPKTDNYQYESNTIISEAEKAVVGEYIVFDDLRTKTKVV